MPQRNKWSLFSQVVSVRTSVQYYLKLCPVKKDAIYLRSVTIHELIFELNLVYVVYFQGKLSVLLKCNNF